MNAIAERYRRFARVEAQGRSRLYEAFANHVAETLDALAFLGRLPRDRQQPNLLFAALRLVAGTPASVKEFDIALGEHGEAIIDVMLTRTTQTNEPGRCAALLPVFSQIEGPLALIEVGASAGLCLLPDFYSYDWDRAQLSPALRHEGNAPVLRCRVSDDVPLPGRYPEIIWRAGLDLNPLDVSKLDDRDWLEHLVWPEQADRLANLRAAIQIAQRERPLVVAGDLNDGLADLIAQAPRGATVVVFHTAVLNYVAEQAARDRFADSMIASEAIWVSNESPRVFPQFAEKAKVLHEDMFLLTVDGKPSAWTGPHGQEVRWI